MASPNTERARARRWRWFWAIVFVLAVAGGFWWWRQVPETFRLAECRPLGVDVSSGALMPNGNLVFFCEVTTRPELLISCFGWHGQRRWRIKTGIPSIVQTSPDGHYLATLTIEPGQRRILRWHDGKPAGGIAFPPTSLIDGLQPLDSGQILCWGNRFRYPPAGTRKIYLVDRDRIAARGVLPMTSSSKLTPCVGYCAPDGRAFLLVDHQTQPTITLIYNHLVIRGDRISLVPVYSTTETIPAGNNHFVLSGFPRFINRDQVLGYQGVYGLQGKLCNINIGGWAYYAGSNTHCTALLLTRSRSSAKYSAPLLEASKVSILNLRTREHYMLPRPQPWNIAAITPDGRFLLCYERPTPGPRKRGILVLAKKVPFLARWINRITNPRLTLYEHYTRPRADLTLVDSRQNLIYLDPATKQRYQFIEVPTALSPDGHTLYILARKVGGRGSALNLLQFER